MNKLDILKSLTFGARVAEDEVGELAKYFVETDQWNRIITGAIDVVRGDKGAGKSAIYSLLLIRENDLFDRNTLLVPGEKPRGTPVFKDIVTAPPTEEEEFVGLWKLYLLSLLGHTLREYDVVGKEASKLYSALEADKLLDREYDLAGILRAAQDLARRLFKAETLEGGLNLDPTTGFPTGMTGKITFREPSVELREKGFITVDRLLGYANAALAASNFQVWLLLDRLDVAFAETQELERNALRALFRVYRDVAEFDQINLKIFLRSDIWARITEGGFREASHITKFAVLTWSQESLLNLIVRRILNNASLVDALSLDKELILSDFNSQRDLFYRLFPAQVDPGARQTTTLDWIISRCADGSAKTAPRELIHFLTCLRDTEISRLERGEAVAPDDQLFDRTVFRDALAEVSDTRFNQTLVAEYPELKEILLKLRGEKTEQTPASLAALWEMEPNQAVVFAARLVEIGFFQARGGKDNPTYWVPFLFRDALSMRQGLADQPATEGHLPH